MAKVLHLKSFKQKFINELSDNDMYKRHVACGRLLDAFPALPKHGKVFSPINMRFTRVDGLGTFTTGAKKIRTVTKNWSTTPYM